MGDKHVNVIHTFRRETGQSSSYFHLCPFINSYSFFLFYLSSAITMLKNVAFSYSHNVTLAVVRLFTVLNVSRHVYDV